MAIGLCEQNAPITYQLADWLSEKSYESSTASSIQYHLVGRVALLAASLLYLTEAVARVAVASLAFAGYLSTVGTWQQAKQFSLEQIDKASTVATSSFFCFCSLASPKELVHRLADSFLTPEMQSLRMIEEAEAELKASKRPRFYREFPEGTALTAAMRNCRIRRGAELIAQKLQTQLDRAKAQAANESLKSFRYYEAPENFQGAAHTETIAGHEVGVCHFIGRRQTMEDEHLVTAFDLTVLGKKYPVQVFGVFDGHGGPEASFYVKQNLERVLHDTLDEFCSNGLTHEAIWNALKITFHTLNHQFNESDAGTTATVSIILDKNLWTANAGDSRAILVLDSAAQEANVGDSASGTQLSEDAKPSDPYYVNGIKNRDGDVFWGRVSGQLAVARAIGDRTIIGVNARPKITVVDLSTAGYLGLFCDGVTDVAATRQITRAILAHKNQTAEQLAKNIVHSAHRAWSRDNLTALIVKI